MINQYETIAKTMKASSIDNSQFGHIESNMTRITVILCVGTSVGAYRVNLDIQGDSLISPTSRSR